MSGTTSGSFLDEVAAASGLSPVIAPFTISRLLLRAGVGSEVDPRGLAAALGEIEAGLRVYLPDDEVAAAMERLRARANL